ncbi:hypothetical protein HK096_003572 [Nowakowskiella sp. JEL0078]|nr:hypothetical protein HK096_003572 [Nowakowskiella sp. JEL0078]
MRYYLQLLSSTVADAKPAVILHFDNQRYLFNCSEGIQRFCNEYKVGLKKLKTMFVSRLNWDCIGGFPGMLLTLADAKVTSFDIYGPPNFMHFLASTRHFIYRASINVHPVELLSPSLNTTNFEPVFKDKSITVYSVFVYPKSLPVSSNKRKYSDGLPNTSFKKSIVEKMFPNMTLKTPQNGKPVDNCCHDDNSKIEVKAEFHSNRTVSLDTLPDLEFKQDTVAITYIVHGPKIVGKFKDKYVRSLGVKSGLDIGKLSRGQSITLSDGSFIDSAICREPGKSGSIFFVVDCPSVDYIENLVKDPSFDNYYDLPDRDNVSIIIHFLGSGVVENPVYKDWMKKFALTQHIIVAPETSAQTLICRKSTDLKFRLNEIDSSTFPIPHYTNENLYKLPTSFPKYSEIGKPLLTYIINPGPKLQKNECLESYIQPQIRLNADASVIPFIPPSLVPPKNGIPMTAIPLGTGGAIPSKYRNVSSTLLLLPRGTVVFDAGENTRGQILRHYGPEMGPRAIARIACIFISHLHADHHLGTISVIKEWVNSGGAGVLYVVCPRNFALFLREYAECEAFGFERVHVLLSETLQAKSGDLTGVSLDGLEALKQSLDLKHIATTRVDHCIDAFGVAIETNCGHKAVFSGDCRPTPALVDLGQNATLLIHEATLADDKQNEALEKKHTTISEALQIAREMKASNLLLTHFSQRYPKFPVVPDSLSSKGLNVAIAFDLSHIDVNTFGKFEAWVPVMKEMFKENEEDESDEELQ